MGVTVANTKRPSVQRKPSTKAVREQRSEAMDEGISLVVDGKTYTVRMGDVTAYEAQVLRRETGMSFMAVMQGFTQSPDIDLIAAVVWLARRLDGEQMLSFVDVAREIGYDVDVDVVDMEADDSPEA